jgi:hypothetical protein
MLKEGCRSVAPAGVGLSAYISINRLYAIEIRRVVKVQAPELNSAPVASLTSALGYSPAWVKIRTLLKRKVSHHVPFLTHRLKCG